MGELTIFSDGSSSTGKDTSGHSCVIKKEGKVLFEGFETSPCLKTSNEEEYLGIIFGLIKAKDYIDNINKIKFYSDSLLAVNQIKKIFKTRDAKLKLLRGKVIKLINSYPDIAISFEFIPREKNKQADNLAKESLWKKK